MLHFIKKKKSIKKKKNEIFISAWWLDGFFFCHYFYSHHATELSKKALSEQQTQFLQCQEHFLWIHKLMKTVGSLKQFNKKQTHVWMDMGVKIKKQQSSEKTRAQENEQHKTVPSNLSVSFKDLWFLTCKCSVRKHLVLMLIKWHNHPKIAQAEFRIVSTVMVLHWHLLLEA